MKEKKLAYFKLILVDEIWFYTLLYLYTVPLNRSATTAYVLMTQRNLGKIELFLSSYDLIYYMQIEFWNK